MRHRASPSSFFACVLAFMLGGLCASQARADDAGVAAQASAAEGETPSGQGDDASATEGEGSADAPEGESAAQGEGATDAPDAAAAALAAAEAVEAAAEAAEEEASAERDPVEEAREVIRSANLGTLAATTRAALQAARPLLRSTSDLLEVERGLPRAEREIQRLGHPTRLRRLPQLSQRELADARGEWRRHGNTLDRWSATLVERATSLEEARGELVTLRRTWAELRDASEMAGRQEGRHERILASLQETREAAGELDRERERILALADRVSALSITVEDVTEQLRSATSAYRDRLLVRDRPPLWAGVSGPDESSSLMEQAAASFAERADTPGELASTLLQPAVQLLFLFAIISGLVLLLARGRNEWPQDEVLAIAREVTRRPFSTAGLVTLLVTPVLVVHAPIVVYDLIFFLMLIPLARVLPPLATVPVRPLVYGSLVFLFVNRVESMLPEGTGVLRIVLLLEALGALAMILFWVRPVWRASERPTAIARAIAVAVAIIISGGIVANIGGWLFLATVLERGTGFSISSGLALLSSVIVAQALLDVMIRSDRGQRLRMLRDHGALVHGRLLRLLSWAALAAWVGATLDAYGVWGPVSSWVEDTLEAEHTVGTFEISLGEVLWSILVLALTGAVVRFTRFVLELDVLPRMRLEPGVDGAISGLTRYIIGATGLLLSLAALGINADQIALVAGALGVGIGFGLQGIVANFIAGLVLMIERPVRLGDFIEVGTLLGSVERIGLRSSTVRALDGAEVIVPNESLISRDVVNWTLSDRRRRVTIKVGVAYGTDPHDALRVIQRVAETHPEVVEAVPPSVIFDGFGDSSLDFSLRFWCRSFADSIRLKSELGLLVHDALKQAGMEIPFPQRDLHLKSLPEGVKAPRVESPTKPEA